MKRYRLDEEIMNVTATTTNLSSKQQTFAVAARHEISSSPSETGGHQLQLSMFVIELEGLH